MGLFLFLSHDHLRDHEDDAHQRLGSPFHERVKNQDGEGLTNYQA